jgi:hypothetical protein
VPAEGGVPIASGLEMFGDQRSVLVGRARIVLFSSGGRPPVEPGAIGFQL